MFSMVKFAPLLMGYFLFAPAAIALPPPEDVPEEILRSQIILEGRSPIDGKPLSAKDYAQLEQELREGKYPPEVSDEIKHIFFLLNLFNFIRIVTPL
ncbi:MAG: hypothetical protein HC796_06355 [Synechococcaceae cyanobacterium RL_1_2]|nr:hypothetical protein [Synechococcaceae cyanobacterium RL_1_2]